MAVIYEPIRPDDEAAILFHRAMHEWHGHLESAAVKVQVLMAEHDSETRDKESKPAVKLHGRPCYAIIKPNSYRDRVQGKADATLIIDKLKWDDLHENEKLALIDHELSHLELALDEDGIPTTDDLGRAVLKSVPHDWELPGGFHAVAHRHKEAAIEVSSIAKFKAEKCGQLVFDWALARG